MNTQHPCFHCDQPVLTPVFSTATAEGPSRVFCCAGCLAVHQILSAKGLGEYYAIKERTLSFRGRAPVEQTGSRYLYLDGEEFQREYGSELAAGTRTMEFYLEGIHCLGCLWLIEKLPELCPGVVTAKLDLDRSVVTITGRAPGAFAGAAAELDQLGYKPHPLKRNQGQREFRQREERAYLLRVGVAGAAAGNVMLYAVSLYGGAGGTPGHLFNWLTVLFGVPALTYSAFPFYRSAWHSLKNRSPSLDVPISIALLVGLGMGLYNLTRDGENYFDSLSALVFLLLLSRYFLRRLQGQGVVASELQFFHRQEGVVRLSDSGERDEIHLGQVAKGDVLAIAADAIFPVDGIILRGQSHVDNALLTGESRPVKVAEGDRVYSGTVNLGDELQIQVESLAGETQLGRILKNVENGWSLKSRVVAFAEVVSKYFTLGVFVLALVLFVWQFQLHGFAHALEQALTLLIVTCPCALALAIPLTFIRSLSLAAKNGIIVKGDDVLENLAQARHIFFDKTGTLTHGQVRITDMRVLHPTPIPLRDIVSTLEKRSRHPVARALRDWAAQGQERECEDYREILGQGVHGNIGGHHYHIDAVGIWEDETLVASFEAQDQVRADSARAITALRALTLAPAILSGDATGTVAQVAQQVGITDYRGNLSPEEKVRQLTTVHPDAIMVGDGANDAACLVRSRVGIAVAGAMDLSLRAADVYLTTPGTVPVVKLVELARETMWVVKRNLVLSVSYNLLSVLAVFTGHITPLVAAIIMPVSSLTVLLSSVYGTRKMRKLWK